jgi:hypothetical protein
MTCTFNTIFCSTSYIQCTERLHSGDDAKLVGISEFNYSIKGFEVHEGFADGEMGSSDCIDIFAIFLMSDDKKYRPRASGYRIILPTVISVSFI